jgi:peptidoglycan/LPS O-acetylase OafA/YrhL
MGGYLILRQSHLGFKIYKFGHNDTSTYQNFGSQLLALAIFYLFYSTQKYTLGFMKKLPILYKIADLTYPLYLLHAAIGLGSIYFIRDYFDNQYVVVLLAIVISCLFAIVIHILIEKPGIAFGKFLINKLQD